MSNKYKESDPRTFTTAAHDEWRELENHYGLYFDSRLRCSAQRGVMVLEVYAYRIANPPGGRPALSYSANWPNSTATSFEAFWYQSWHKVARQCEEWYKSQTSATA